MTSKHILPSSHLIQQLQEDLSRMSICDYDLTELLSNTVTALEFLDVIDVRLREFCVVFSRHGSPMGGETSDGNTLAAGWLKFTMGVCELYRRGNLWNDRGQANFYYHSLVGGDMMLCDFPPP
jgi:hypothetical protein